MSRSLYGQIRSFSVTNGQIRSFSVNFGQFRSFSVYYGLLRSITVYFVILLTEADFSYKNPAGQPPVIIHVPGPVVLYTARVCTPSSMFQVLLYCTLLGYVPHYGCTRPCCTVHYWGMYPINHVPSPVVLYSAGVQYPAGVCTPSS